MAKSAAFVSQTTRFSDNGSAAGWMAVFRAAVVAAWLVMVPWISVIAARAQSKPKSTRQAVVKSPPRNQDAAMYQPPISQLAADVSPTSIYSGTPTPVTVLASVPQTKGLSQVALLRVSNGSRRQIGHLDLARNVGSSAVYSAQIVLNERSGAVELQVEAQYQAAYATYNAPPRSGAVESNVLRVSVLPGQGSQPALPGGRSGGGGFWSSFGGAAAGALAGSLIDHFLENHLHPPPPQVPPHTGNQEGQIQQAPPEKQVKPTPPSPPNDTLLEAKGLKIRYPSGWCLFINILELGGPIALRISKSRKQGGVLYYGDAEIEVTSVPGGSESVADTAHAELGSSGVPQFVDGKPAMRVYYIDQFTPSLVYESIAVYVAGGTQFYKFFLSYRAGDPQKEMFVSNFDRILANTHFGN